jgi:(p)ppGpp synthase/HD superfamily hydrolase
MLTERFDDALVFASRLHRHQVRKAIGVPYISHLIAVAGLVLEDGGTEAEGIAALLHDAVEDCGDTYEGGRPALRARIDQQFGPEVLAIVNACTDDDGMAKGKAPTLELERAAWMERKRRYLDTIPSHPLPALRVCCADKLHNLRCTVTDYERMGEDLWARFRPQSGDYQMWYFDELVRVFLKTELPRLPIQFAREVEKLRELMSVAREAVAYQL